MHKDSRKAYIYGKLCAVFLLLSSFQIIVILFRMTIDHFNKLYCIYTYM